VHPTTRSHPEIAQGYCRARPHSHLCAPSQYPCASLPAMSVPFPNRACPRAAVRAPSTPIRTLVLFVRAPFYLCAPSSTIVRAPLSIVCVPSTPARALLLHVHAPSLPYAPPRELFAPPPHPFVPSLYPFALPSCHACLPPVSCSRPLHTRSCPPLTHARPLPPVCAPLHIRTRPLVNYSCLLPDPCAPPPCRARPPPLPCAPTAAVRALTSPVCAS
jgi:hypothetical protein